MSSVTRIGKSLPKALLVFFKWMEMRFIMPRSSPMENGQYGMIVRETRHMPSKYFLLGVKQSGIFLHYSRKASCEKAIGGLKGLIWEKTFFRKSQIEKKCFKSINKETGN